MEAAYETVQAQGVDLESLLLDTYHVAKSDFGVAYSASILVVRFLRMMNVQFWK